MRCAICADPGGELRIYDRHVRVALCDSCNFDVAMTATSRELPKRFPRVVVIRPAPAPVLVELARELSIAVRA